jgi:hypothetical protein
MTSSAFPSYSEIVKGRKEIGSAFERTLTPSLLPTERPRAEETPARLNIFVVFTSVEATIAALKQAGRLATELGGRIILMALQVVPYPLPLTRPPVGIDWNERRLRLIAGESHVETIVHVHLCRDWQQTLEDALRAHSLVVLGGHKRWWPTREGKLARSLRRAGHEVIFVEAE